MRDMDSIYEAFEGFARNATQAIVLCADDEGTTHLASRLDGAAPVLTYGTHSHQPDFRLENIDLGAHARFELAFHEQRATCELAVPGPPQRSQCSGSHRGARCQWIHLSGCRRGRERISRSRSAFSVSWRDRWCSVL